MARDGGNTPQSHRRSLMATNPYVRSDFRATNCPQTHVYVGKSNVAEAITGAYTGAWTGIAKNKYSLRNISEQSYKFLV